ncbi:MAG: uncharacterized protein V7603_6254 [Micromonosporaceae bacterium]
MGEGLELADYRRRVAEMYLTPPVDGVEGWTAFRAARERLFRDHPQSALEPATRASFTGLPYFDYDRRYRVPARLAAPSDDAELVIETGGEDGAIRCRREARLVTPFGELTLFWITGYGGGLFLPFRDATAGRETYGGGRYLADTIKGTFGRGLTVAGDEVVLDFNYAYNPSCVYNSRYLCPLAPRENWLATPIPAGERV